MVVPAAENGKMGDDIRIGDLIEFGRYAVLVCLVTELSLAHIVSNMLYMIYAGAAVCL
jgi:hypothetical protein